MSKDSGWKEAYEAREDLFNFKDNAIGLFALALRFSIDDLEAVAAECITDGSNDKKTDIVYIDKEKQLAVIAQCYCTKKNSQEAPANKAADLNTAVAWLLQRNIKDLPERLVSAAQELHELLESGSIKHLHIWYVHNLPESKNVSDELITVQHTATSALKRFFSKSGATITTLEVGNNTLGEWYNDTQSPILVTDTIEIQGEHGFEIIADKWSSYTTYIPVNKLRSLYKKHKTKLFSANVRDYLGSISRDANINNGIKNTAENSPENFWIYNNGITAIVNDFKRDDSTSTKSKYIIKGISIVNGAQTTGALGSLKKNVSNANVMIRFIKTTDSETIKNIVRYNNSQNQVTASDFRSTDSIQKRLRDEISKIAGAEYEGGRRGGAADAIKRRPRLMPSYTVGQALAAFHGDPITAYNKKSDIWTSDTLYSKLFNEQTTGVHLVFAYSLLRAVEEKKQSLLEKGKKDESTLTGLEKRQLAFFRMRGAIPLLVAAIAACIETITSRRISSIFKLSFGAVNPQRGKEIWEGIVEKMTPLCQQLSPCLTNGLKNNEQVRTAIESFQALVESTKEPNSDAYKSFTSMLKI